MDDSASLSPSFDPRTDFDRWLVYGAAAVLTAGVLDVVGSALVLQGWKQDEFGLVMIVKLLISLPLAIVLVTYYKLSQRVQKPSLRKSAVGLFGAILLTDVANLNSTDDEPRWWNVVIWFVLAIAAVLLVILVCNLVEFEQEMEKEEKEAAAAATSSDAADGSSTTPTAATDTPATTTTTTDETSGSGKQVGAIIGGIGFVCWILFKVAMKFAVIRALKITDSITLEAVVMLAILLMASVFLVWFAIVKIRLRHLLGTLAAATGLLELLLIVLASVLVVGMISDLYQAINQAGFNEQAAAANIENLEAKWMLITETGSIVVSIFWSMLTAGLFISYRNRLHEPQDVLEN